MRWKSANANPPCAKCQHVANAHCTLDNEDYKEEIDDTPLARANIPKIINAILSNFSKEGTSLRDDS